MPFRNLLLVLFIFTISVTFFACSDIATLKKRDNKTDNATGGDNSDNNSKPPLIDPDGELIVTDEMLRPFKPENFQSSHNYTINDDKLLVEGTVTFTDSSLSKVDNCSKEFYDSLTDEKFRHNNKIYLTNRKHVNEFSRIFHGMYDYSSLDITYILAKDIDLCKSKDVKPFIPIGRPETGSATYFASKFDGDNHIIKNLYIKYNAVDDYNCVGFICGLKAAYSGGSLHNIGVAGDIEITADWQSANGNGGAGLVGFSVGGDVKNVVSNINITGRKNIGGIVGRTTTGESSNGYAKPSTIVNAINYGKIYGTHNIGGIVGIAVNGNIANNSKAKNEYNSITNWGTITSNNQFEVGALFGSYDNHDNMVPISCKNGGKPATLYGKSTITFTCD